MIVLVTNDDGIDAPGLRSLVHALSRGGHRVYLAAPLKAMSGMGKAMVIDAAYGEIEYSGAVKAWWVDSTPAAAVYVALKRLLDVEPDAIVSGVNRGPNMGFEDFFTSGTVGAAIEGALNGVPSMAVSLATDHGHDESEYNLASEIAVELAGVLDRLEPGELLNVNVPVIPRGLMATRMAWNNYRVNLVEVSGRIRPASNAYRERYWDREAGTDVWAVFNDYVSVTLIDLRRLHSGGVDVERAASILDEVMVGVKLGGLQRNSS